MQTTNAPPGKPGTTSNMPQGAQTVSIGNKHMMTYIPNGEGGGGDGNSGHPSEQPTPFNSCMKNTGLDDMKNNNKPVPLASSILDREESLDDDAFNASLDAFLKDDQGYDDVDVDPLIDYNLTPSINNANNEGGSGGRKRKASHAFLTEISSLTNSSDCTAAAAAVAASLQQQQQQDADTAALHSAAAAGTAAAAAPNNMAYSTQGSLVQLPPSLLFPPPAPRQAAAASSVNPPTAVPGGMTIGSLEHQQLQQQQQNTLASNLMKSMSPLTASLFQQPGGATTVTATNNNAPMLGARANEASVTTAVLSSNNLGGTNNTTAGNAFDNLFGFNSIPELSVAPSPPHGGVSPPAPTESAPLPVTVQSATINSLAAAAASAQQLHQQQQGGYQTAAGGTTTSATSMSFTDASSNPNTNTKKRRGPKQQQKDAKPPTVQSSSDSNLLVSEDEAERLKRRSIRNIREQQRSNKIAERITELRKLLQDAGVQHKTDRYSTLVGVVNYVKMLQRRSKKLDEEHKVLLETITGAGEMVNGASAFGGLPPPPPKPPGTTTVQTFDVSGENASSISSDRDNNDEEVLSFVQGIDYRFIFANCGVALAIASVDGRFVDCNDEWLRLTGYSRKELMGESKHRGGNHRPTSKSVASTAAHAPAASVKSASFPPSEILIGRQHLSLFNLLGREDMETVYTAMSRMLRSSPPNTRTNTTSSSSSSSDPNASDSFLESISGNEAASGVEGDNIQRYTVDHWAGKVKHTRRKQKSVSRSCLRVRFLFQPPPRYVKSHSRITLFFFPQLQLNISLVRTDDGRPKFFNCALSEAN
eukprot:scaffold15824_cov155-Skeletonema_menzelii.AAC.2